MADQLSSTLTTKNSLKSITIEFSETGLEAGNINKFYLFPGATSVFTHGGNTLNYAVYVDPTDTLFGETDKIFSGSLTGTGSHSSPSPQLIEYLTTPFSITEVLTLTLDPTATGRFTPTVDEGVTLFTPEPSALVCLGSAVLLLGLIGNRRRARIERAANGGFAAGRHGGGVVRCARAWMSSVRRARRQILGRLHQR